MNARCCAYTVVLILLTIRRNKQNPLILKVSRRNHKNRAAICTDQSAACAVKFM